jgi:hypothetical protein
MTPNCSFTAALLSDEPASEYAGKLGLYGQFAAAESRTQVRRQFRGALSLAGT